MCWALDQERKEAFLQEMKRVQVPFRWHIIVGYTPFFSIFLTWSYTHWWFVLKYLHRFYTETSSDNKSSIEKWSSPTVHELRTIYQNFQISNVLHQEADKTVKALQNLRADELRFYCRKYKLPSGGKKVVYTINTMCTVHPA